MSDRLTVVLGVGQAGQGDAAAGLAVADRLAAMPAGLDASVMVIRHQDDGDALLHILRSFERVILVCSIIPTSPSLGQGLAGHAAEPACRWFPGQILLLQGWEVSMPPPVEWASPVRGLSIGNALRLALSVGAWPDRLSVYGIVSEQWHSNAPLSDSVRDGIPNVLDQVCQTLSDWLGHDDIVAHSAEDA